MQLTNSHDRFGAVTKSFHWLTALLVITLIPLGIIAHDAPYTTTEELQWKALLFSIHKTLGVTVFFVALARILWALSQPKPRLLNAGRRAESFLAETIHWLLYSSLVLVPLTGWIHHAATEGFAPIWWPFSQNLPLVPTNDAEVAHLFSALHFTFERVLAFSVLLHVAGALKHHLIDRDATLRRMLPGRPDLPALTPHSRSHAPVFAAGAAYLGALIAGAFLWYLPGLDQQVAAISPRPNTQQQGNWTVDDGTLSITVTQLGNTVTGNFGDWDAVIEFDESVQDGQAGTVNVIVSTASLDLGALTPQAIAADFMDTAGFPTATFTADILRDGESYVADGALTLKGVTLPLRMPFALSLDGDQAAMTSELALERLDFGIGQSMPDGSSLGLGVSVNVDLTATH